jgi:hypothetical protein
LSNRYPQSSIYLQLRHLPVWLDGLEVWEDTDAYAGQGTGAFADADKLILGDDYYLDLDQDSYSESGMLIRECGWPNEPRTVKVSYYGGWTAAQLAGKASDIKMATMITVAKAFNQARTQASTGGNGPVSEETIGKYRVKYATDEKASMNGFVVSVPPEAKELVSDYKNYGRYLA